MTTDNIAGPATTFDGDDAGMYRAGDDPRDESPSEIVPRVVAALEDVDPIDLPPLYRVIDPDALDNLFRSPDGLRNVGGEVTFEYCGYRVVVSADGEIAARPVGARSQSS